MSEEKKRFSETAKYKSNKTYIEKNYSQVKLSMPNEEADTLRTFCKANNMSVAGLIRQLVKDEISKTLYFDHREKEFFLRAIYPDGSMEILGKYPDKETALAEGKRLHDTAAKGTRISCIKGVVNKDGQIEGSYLLYDSWQ